MRQPTFFLSHGGGPWIAMDGAYRQAHARLEAHLRALPASLSTPPRAVLMVSGHWEAPAFTVGSAAQPGMVYDYSGFPPHTYTLSHPAPGAPALAARAQALVEAAGLPAAADSGRGLDHGAFVPLMAMNPGADWPVVMLSLRAGLDAAEHLALGRALAPLRDEGVLIVGSGLSFHNMRGFGPAGRAASAGFDAWLQAALPSPDGRAARLADWAAAPAARQAHPREEHLLPLMVAAGAAEGEAGRCVYTEAGFLGGVTVSSFQFG